MTGTTSFSSCGGYLETAQVLEIYADVAFGELVTSSDIDYDPHVLVTLFSSRPSHPDNDSDSHAHLTWTNFFHHNKYHPSSCHQLQDHRGTFATYTMLLIKSMLEHPLVYGPVGS